MTFFKLLNYDTKSIYDSTFYWFIFQVGISYIIAYYTENDLRALRT